MTNNPTIDGVSRELRQLLDASINGTEQEQGRARNELRALLDAPVVERQEPEFPAGAIHNGRAFIDQLESIYAFKEQQGHPLSLCSEWQELVRCFEWLAAHATDSQSTIARLEARVAELERCKMSIWPSEETLMAAGLGYPIGKEQAVKIYKASLQSRTDTPENADCEWCYGAGHDYYGDPCCGCCKPDQGKIAKLVSELDRPAPKPFAYTTTSFIELAKTHSHTGRLVASFQENVFWNQPLFTAPPAPAAVAMSFEFEHPSSKEKRTVTLTKRDVFDGMEDYFYDKLGEQICQCESVGETNVVDCNCDEYVHDFEIVDACLDGTAALNRRDTLTFELADADGYEP